VAERTPFPWGKPIPKLTIEEMHFAILVAAAASTGSMPIDWGDKSVGASELERHVFSIAAALKHDPVKAAAAAYREVVITLGVFADEIHPALVEAIATFPSTFGKVPSTDRVFRLAESIKARISVL
jgi:hypothetical protein